MNTKETFKQIPTDSSTALIIGADEAYKENEKSVYGAFISLDGENTTLTTFLSLEEVETLINELTALKEKIETTNK